MTIYVSNLRELPRDEMAKLDATSKFSVQKNSSRITAFVYDWPDLRIIVNVMPDSERANHLEELVRWLEDRSQLLDNALSDELVARIRSSMIVLGLVIEKTTDRNVWHDRIQDMIGMICFNTKSIVFWEGMIFDENCSQVWPSTE